MLTPLGEAGGAIANISGETPSRIRRVHKEDKSHEPDFLKLLAVSDRLMPSKVLG